MPSAPIDRARPDDDEATSHGHDAGGDHRTDEVPAAVENALRRIARLYIRLS